jgi:ABC-type transporter Mla MlaB component
VKPVFDLSLDVSGARGTLSLRGVVTRIDVEAAARMCTGLPRSVQVLRIDLRGVSDLEESARLALRSLIRDWRFVRRRFIAIVAEPPGAKDLVSSASW